MSALLCDVHVHRSTARRPAVVALDGTAGAAELEQLKAASQPATFGRNSEDVLDETYRKVFFGHVM